HRGPRPHRSAGRPVLPNLTRRGRSDGAAGDGGAGGDDGDPRRRPCGGEPDRARRRRPLRGGVSTGPRRPRGDLSDGRPAEVGASRAAAGRHDARGGVHAHRGRRGARGGAGSGDGGERVVRVWPIYKKELRLYFTSPVAYVLLTIFLLIAGYFFYSIFAFF